VPAFLRASGIPDTSAIPGTLSPVAGRVDMCGCPAQGTPKKTQRRPATDTERWKLDPAADRSPQLRRAQAPKPAIPTRRGQPRELNGCSSMRQATAAMRLIAAPRARAAATQPRRFIDRPPATIAARVPVSESSRPRSHLPRSASQSRTQWKARMVKMIRSAFKGGSCADTLAITTLR
jgi:hypothetical protein